jgi:hypothetical protein
MVLLTRPAQNNITGAHTLLSALFATIIRVERSGAFGYWGRGTTRKRG